jgi:hypothetical protein
MSPVTYRLGRRSERHAGADQKMAEQGGRSSRRNGPGVKTYRSMSESIARPLD